MQRILMFIDYGDGWQPLNDHEQDLAALTDFTIRWGIDNIGDSATPAVLNFTLVDRTGMLVGEPTRFAGARVCVQLARLPLYKDVPESAGSYAAQTLPVREWYKLAVSPMPNRATSDAFTIFYGLCSTGGKISKLDDGYKIELQASSTMILWKRLSEQGPVSTNLAFEGKHWVNTSGAERFNQLADRARKANAPMPEASGVSFPASVAPYDLTSYPTYLTLLEKLTNHLPQLYAWCETPRGETSVLRPYALMEKVGLALNPQGILYTISAGVYNKELPSNRIQVDDESLTVPSPVTQISIEAVHASRDSQNKLTFEQADVSYTAPSLPDNLKTVQATLSRESDAIAVSDDGTLPAWAPSELDRRNAEDNIKALNMRILPTELIFKSNRLDPAQYPDLYMTAPSPIYMTTRTMWDRLAASHAPWRTIGGTLTYEYNTATPKLTHKVIITSVAIDKTTLTYNDLNPVTASYKTLNALSISTFSQITSITTKGEK